MLLDGVYAISRRGLNFIGLLWLEARHKLAERANAGSRLKETSRIQSRAMLVHNQAPDSIPPAREVFGACQPQIGEAGKWAVERRGGARAKGKRMDKISKTRSGYLTEAARAYREYGWRLYRQP